MATNTKKKKKKKVLANARSKRRKNNGSGKEFFYEGSWAHPREGCEPKGANAVLPDRRGAYEIFRGQAVFARLAPCRPGWMAEGEPKGGGRARI